MMRKCLGKRELVRVHKKNKHQSVNVQRIEKNLFGNKSKRREEGKNNRAVEWSAVKGSLGEDNIDRRGDGFLLEKESNCQMASKDLPRN